MKNIKKLSLITLLSAGALLATSCSQGAQNNTPTSSQAEQKQETKLSNEDIMKKVKESMSSAKSIENIKKATIEDSVYGKTTQETTVKYILEPFVSEATMKFTSEGKTLVDSTSYIKGTDAYYKTPTGWSKNSLDNERITAEKSIFTNPLEDIIKYGKDYTITENDKEYIIEFKPSDLKKWFEQVTKNDKTLDREKSNYSTFTLKHTIDKSTFRIATTDVRYVSKFVRTGNSVSQTIDETNTFTITHKYDTFTSIELPADIK